MSGLKHSVIYWKIIVLTRKKRASKGSYEPEERPENREQVRIVKLFPNKQTFWFQFTFGSGVTDYFKE